MPSPSFSLFPRFYSPPATQPRHPQLSPPSPQLSLAPRSRAHPKPQARKISTTTSSTSPGPPNSATLTATPPSAPNAIPSSSTVSGHRMPTAPIHKTVPTPRAPPIRPSTTTSILTPASSNTSGRPTAPAPASHPTPSSPTPARPFARLCSQFP